MAQKEVFPSPLYKQYLMNEIFGKSIKRSHARYMLKLNQAHCIMLRDTGIIKSEIAREIMEELNSFTGEIDSISMSDFKGEIEDLFFLFEKKMIADIGIVSAGALHTGRSRNDIGHTILRLAFRDRLYNLIVTLRELINAFFIKAKETTGDIIVAWTHAQPAQPTTYGHYLSAVLEVLLRDTDRLLYNYRYVDCSPFGAAAITTTGFPIDRMQTASLLGFRKAVTNSYGSIAATDYILNTAGILKSLFIHLGKFAFDQLDWCRMEIRQIDVPDSWVQISSIMPQKRNAVVFEHLRARFNTLASLCDVPGNSIRSTPFGDIDDIEVEFHEQFHKLFDLAQITIPLLSKVVSVITINSENSQKMIDRYCILATELADMLVIQEKISFRQAHEVASKISRYCIEQKMNLSEVSDEMIVETFQGVTGVPLTGSVHTIMESLTPQYFINVRKVLGGSAPEAMADSFAEYSELIDEIDNSIREIKQRHTAAEIDLEKQIKEMVDAC